MCVIIANGSGKLPTIDILKAAEAGNDDGIGLAWLAEGGVSFRKGITFKRLTKLLIQVELKKLPYVIHFRAATQGGIADRLCHPFPLTTKWEKLDALAGDGLPAVVAHNGTWRSWEKHFKANEVKWLQDNNWSDSAIIAWLLAAGKELSLPISGYGNRLAFLSRKAGIKLWGDGWKEEDGIHFSNTFWRYQQNTLTYSPKDSWEDSWLSYATQSGWAVGSHVGEQGGKVLHRGAKRRYVAQNGTSYCEGHKEFDTCWKGGGYTAAQAEEDLNSAGACELIKASKQDKQVASGATGTGVTRNFLSLGEVVVQTKIFRRVTATNGYSYLVDTGDRCFEKNPIQVDAAPPLPESGNAEDRAVMEIKNK